MAEQYTYQKDDSAMVNEDAMTYPQGVTIPITLPSTGGYSVDLLKKELTDFAMKLLHRSTTAQAEQTAAASTNVKEHSQWVQSMAKFRRLEPTDSKEAILESLDERYR